MFVCYGLGLTAPGSTGVPWGFWQVVAFRDGKVCRFEWYTDRADALDAIGLAR